MSTSFKIRILLLILTFGFAITAISLHFTFSKKEILELDGRAIEQNIQKKERYIYSYLADTSKINALRTVHNYPAKATALIKNLSKERSIFVYTYSDHELLFWSSDQIVPRSDLGMKEGFNRLKTRNGWYGAIKKSFGEFSVVFIIPIKIEYPYQNKYLKNSFAPDLIKDNSVEIASFSDKNIYNLRNIDGEYILAVKLKSSLTNSIYSDLELWMTLLTIFVSCIFVNASAMYLAKRRQTALAFAVVFLYTVVLKMGSVYFPIFSTYFNISLFDIRHYAGGVFFKSIGDFLITGLLLSWFLYFVYTYRRNVNFSKYKLPQIVFLLIYLAMGLLLYGITNKLSDLFFDVITRSDINFDLSNILYLDMFSWVAILLLFIGSFCMFLLLEILIYFTRTLQLKDNLKYLLFVAGVVLVLCIEGLSGTFNLYAILFSILVVVQWKSQLAESSTSRFLYLLIVLLLFSIITSIKLSTFQFIKEREQRKIIAYKLETAEDPNAVLLLFSIEQDLLKDEGIIRAFDRRTLVTQEDITDNLKKQYFDGYLSRYELSAYMYSPEQLPLYKDQPAITSFRSLVLAGSIKVSENFYSINNTFGYQNYFGIIPIRERGQLRGLMVITLKSKAFKDSHAVPGIFVDNKMNVEKDLRNYSFAFYLNDRLLNQNGKYTYTLNNVFKTRKTKTFTFEEDNGYNHLIYQSTNKKVIVVSTPKSNWIAKLASVSFLFLSMSTLLMLLMLLHQIWNVLEEEGFSFKLTHLVKIFPANRLLYSTRIQATLVGAIVFTLFVVGVITYFSISHQFKQQLQDELVDKINKISTGLEKESLFSTNYSIDRDRTLHSFASVNATDICLYNTIGKLTFSTQNKIYENGLLDYSMNPQAYISLGKYQQSELVNEEKIGSLDFITVYKPLRNNRNVTIAYLALPYYSYQADFDDLIGEYLNTLVNVYALLLVTIAFFAIFLANRITYPLTLVSKSLGEIKVGGKNEQINWKSNDEIGSLIREYNKMILALEANTLKLARSERESAWREMAKQVAHEIKNPLTPLKLGVQLLERSWKGQDPKFDEKFARFSKSFIEQIESLAAIASEFSNFAKLPDAPMEDLEILEPIRRAIEVANLAGIYIDLIAEKREMVVRGNREHLIKIFNNLFKNAMEAIPVGQAPKISIEVSSTDNHVKIKIKDNGSGIDPELRDQIFNPNFTTKTSGTGLGLSFVKQGVENMLGIVFFETELNKGTCFTIKLPHPTTLLNEE